MATRNKNSRVTSQQFGSTRLTETTRRDEGTLAISLVSEGNGHRTDVVLERAGSTMVLTGRELRTLLTVLDHHFVA